MSGLVLREGAVNVTKALLATQDDSRAAAVCRIEAIHYAGLPRRLDETAEGILFLVVEDKAARLYRERLGGSKLVGQNEWPTYRKATSLALASDIVGLDGALLLEHLRRNCIFPARENVLEGVSGNLEIILVGRDWVQSISELIKLTLRWPTGGQLHSVFNVNDLEYTVDRYMVFNPESGKFEAAVISPAPQ